MLHLSVHLSASETTDHHLTRPVVTVGRSPDNDVVIPSHGLASRHARLILTPEGDAYRLEALEGVLGTFVNGHQIRSGILESGDHIRFGSVEAVVTTDHPSAVLPEGGDPLEAATARIADLQAASRARDAQLATLHQELATKTSEATRFQSELLQTKGSLAKAEHEHQAREAEWTAYSEAQSSELAQASASRDAALGERARHLAKIEELERRLADLDESARKRIQRGHDTIAALRKKTTQQESELRETRYEIMKLRRGKEAADTLLESMKRCYSRDKKQHNRLVEQFRERARQETLRAEAALQQLAKASAAAAKTNGGTQPAAPDSSAAPSPVPIKVS